MADVIGAMRDQLTLRRPVTVKDGYGQESITWQLVDTVWAKRSPGRAAERFAAVQMQSDHIESFVIRSGIDVQDTWRAECGGIGYDIKGVTLMPDRRFIELLCARGVKDGR